MQGEQEELQGAFGHPGQLEEVLSSQAGGGACKTRSEPETTKNGYCNSMVFRMCSIHGNWRSFIGSVLDLRTHPLFFLEGRD